jgi:hypothetical protein
MRSFIKMLAAIWIIALSMTNFVGCSNDKDDDCDNGRRDLLSGQLLILQAYGSSGDALGASHSFVEIYNNSDTPINLSGITLFHADGIRGLPAREAGVDDNWRAIPLSGTIPAKTSFLILGARENTTGRLSINDNSGDINDPNFSLSNRAFKVALIRGATPLTVQNPFTMDGNGSQIAVGFIDLLGTANSIDHATNPDNIFGYKGTPARNSASEAVRRITLDGTDNNAADFESIRYAHGGVDDDKLEHFRPKNREFGAWNPLTGELIGYRGRAEGTLPVIFIDTYGAEIHGSATGIWTNMTFSLNDPNNPQNNIATIRNQEIRGRGNTTWGYPKQPFRIRFRNDTSMFGLAARRNWILLAEFQDPTFLTNAATLYLGREVFNLPYTNTHKHVHLYLDGEYWGVYLLTEHRQADPNGIGAPGRANVDFNNGGWFVQLDVGTDEPWFETDNFNLPVNISAPSFSDNIDDPRYRFIIDDWAEFTDLLACQTFPENGWRDLVDINSLVDFIMANEIVQNFEPNHPKSTFFYRRSRNDKISAGMLWDFDWGFGYGPLGSHTYISDYTTFGSLNTMHLPKHRFFQRFFEDPVFLVKYKERWNEKYDENVAISEFMETLGENIRFAVEEDFKRWNIPGGYWDDYDSDHARQTGLMVDWWKRRITWLNTEQNKVEVLPASKIFEAQSEYSEITPQIFTLVAYDEMSNLTAILRKGDLSNFEISTGLVQTPTGNGGYLATINVKPKNSLPPGTHTDMLVLNGSNQGNPFSFEVPLSFENGSVLRAWTQNNMLYVSGLAEGKPWRVYSVSGTLVYQATANSNREDIVLPEQGVYIIQSEDRTLKVVVLK